jgi:ABC-type transport system involved in cytochrome c biogenesis permease subunit
LIIAFLFLVFGLALGGTVVTTVQAVNTTGWTFTGYEGVIAMIDLFPLIYYAAIILGFLGIVWVSIKMSGS